MFADNIVGSSLEIAKKNLNNYLHLGDNDAILQCTIEQWTIGWGVTTMANNVFGSTSSDRPLLSDDAIKYRIEKRRACYYRYEPFYVPNRDGSRTRRWAAVVIGPFHSRLYGVNAIRTKRKDAKATLKQILASRYGYIGNLVYREHDEGDTVGRAPDPRVVSDYAQSPISVCEAVGKAGM